MKVNNMVMAGSEIQNGTEEESVLLRQTASQSKGKKSPGFIGFTGFWFNSLGISLFIPLYHPSHGLLAHPL